ncbi:MAG: uridylate kinase [Methylococcaceae bacterium]
MIVVKLGGSLSKADALINCLNKLEKNYTDSAVVIVPGGGAFADQVRIAQQRWQFDDITAHRMAILAMQQMALLIKGLKSNFSIAHSITDILKQAAQQKIVIWSPDIVELDNAAIKASWDITSDSLAAWLACELSARELVLVKSAMIDHSLNLQQLTELGIVDQGFCDFARQACFKISIINQSDF